jgi:hypothetical protein
MTSDIAAFQDHFRGGEDARAQVDVRRTDHVELLADRLPRGGDIGVERGRSAGSAPSTTQMHLLPARKPARRNGTITSSRSRAPA